MRETRPLFLVTIQVWFNTDSLFAVVIQEEEPLFYAEQTLIPFAVVTPLFVCLFLLN